MQLVLRLVQLPCTSVYIRKYLTNVLLPGVVSIEAMGGPSIPFRAGRVDAMDPSDVTPDGRLPEVRTELSVQTLHKMLSDDT